MKTSKTRLWIDAAILVAVLIAGYVSIQNATSIGDWLHLRNYEPSSKIATVAERAGMNDKGKRLFYRFSPEFVDKDKLEQECSQHSLGCAVGRKIYILDARNKREEYRSAVTAAHEMLHVAYSRLSESEKTELFELLDKQIAMLSGAEVISRFSSFTGDDYYNEAHSYLATEAPDLTSELEAYYSDYFSERDLVTAAYRLSPEE